MKGKRIHMERFKFVDRLSLSSYLCINLLILIIVSVGFGQDNKSLPVDPDVVGTCTIDQLSSIGQGYQYDGSNGGFIQLPVGHESYSRTDFRNVTLRNITTSLLNTGYQPQDMFNGTENVIIMVVDNFELNTGKGFSGIPVFKLRPAVFDLPPELFGPEGPVPKDIHDIRNHFNRMQDSISHGALVRNHINTVFEYLSVAPTPLFQQMDMDSDRRDDVWLNLQSSTPSEPVTVTIKSVDISGETTLGIAEAIERVLNAHQNSRVVVNMSFSLVPCGLKSGLEREDGPFNSYQDYIRFVMNRDGISMNEFWGVINSRIRQSNDPLISLIAGFEESDKVSFVSSSGNFGMDFPLLPAALDNVHAVSASHPATQLPSLTPIKAEWANKGQLMTDGSYYLLHDAIRDTQSLIPLTHQNVPLYYAGTSYSGPNVSILMALNFSHPVPLCGNDTLLRNSSSFNDEFVPDAFLFCGP